MLMFKQTLRISAHDALQSAYFSNLHGNDSTTTAAAAASDNALLTARSPAPSSSEESELSEGSSLSFDEYLESDEESGVEGIHKLKDTCDHNAK